jgi:lysophospholipase-3
MFGAPYDFRYVVAPAGHPSKVGDAFLRALKGLVERASRLNGGRPVTIVTHSAGGPLTHQLLVRQTLAWRRRFVRRFVPIAAPWGGAVLGMLTLVSGNNYGLPFVDARALLASGRSQQTSLWTLPSPSPAVFGTARPLVITKSRNYSAGDVADYLADIGFGEAVGPYESRVLPLFGGELPPPGVPVTNIVGVGVGTTERIVYPGDDFEGTPAMVTGDGDGVVNLASALAVETKWKDYRLVKVSNMTHNDLVADDRALEIVIREIQRAN